MPVVSDASGSVCEHGVNGLIHRVADVETLAAHLTALHEDPSLLAALRDGCLRTAPEYTWTRAGERLVEVYQEVVADRSPSGPRLRGLRCAASSQPRPGAV